jgi:hypothetical protein
MAVFGIIVGEELLTEDAGVLDAAEPFWECRAVFQGFIVNTNAGGGWWQSTDCGAV